MRIVLGVMTRLGSSAFTAGTWKLVEMKNNKPISTEAVISVARFTKKPPGEGTTRETLRRECSMHPSERHRNIGLYQGDRVCNTICPLSLYSVTIPLVTGADLIAVQEQLIRHGFVVAVYSHGNDVYSIVFVLNNFGHEKLRPSLARARPYFEPFGRPAQLRIRGRDVYAYDDFVEPADFVPFEEPFPLPFVKKSVNVKARIPVAPWLTTWFEGNNLIVVAGPAESIGDEPGPNSNKTLAEMHMDVVASVLDTTDGKQPNVESISISTQVSGDRSTRRVAELPRNGSMCRRGRLRQCLGACPDIGLRSVQVGEAVLFGKSVRAVDAA
jgi:hypothetical protein